MLSAVKLLLRNHLADPKSGYDLEQAKHWFIAARAANLDTPHYQVQRRK